MSDELNPNDTPETVAPIEDPAPNEGTPEDELLPAALREVDPEKMKEFREKIAAFREARGKTISGSEATDESPRTTDDGKPIGETPTGKDVDWSEYDLEYSIRHLYPQAVYRETPEGPRWVALLDEFFSTEKAAKAHGRKVNIPGSVDKTDTEPLNLGEYLSQLVNGPEGWKIAALMPGSQGQALVLLQKKTPIILPNPSPIKKAVEVEAPKDPELQKVEDAAIEFMSEEGLTPPPITEDNGGEQETVNLQPVPADQVEVDEVGALPPRDSALISRAFDLNRSETVAAPAGPQPDPIVIENPGLLGERGRIASGVMDVKKIVGDIMQGDDFGTLEHPKS